MKKRITGETLGLEQQDEGNLKQPGSLIRAGLKPSKKNPFGMRALNYFPKQPDYFSGTFFAIPSPVMEDWFQFGWRMAYTQKHIMQSDFNFPEIGETLTMTNKENQRVIFHVQEVVATGKRATFLLKATLTLASGKDSNK